MKTDLLADRHIGIQEEDLPVMLEKIGVKSLDELINKTILITTRDLKRDLKIHIVRISRLRKINFWSRIEEARAMAIFNLAVWKEVMRLTL